MRRMILVMLTVYLIAVPVLCRGAEKSGLIPV